MHLSMLIPRVEGDGQSQGNLTLSREPESNSPPLGTEKMSNSHPYPVGSVPPTLLEIYLGQNSVPVIIFVSSIILKLFKLPPNRKGE